MSICTHTLRDPIIHMALIVDHTMAGTDRTTAESTAEGRTTVENTMESIVSSIMVMAGKV